MAVDVIYDESGFGSGVGLRASPEVDSGLYIEPVKVDLSDRSRQNVLILDANEPRKYSIGDRYVKVISVYDGRELE